MITIKSEIFRQYDIRGIVGKDLDEQVAYRIGRAFGIYLKSIIPSAQRVSVGRDVRLSSDELAGGAIKGITDAGIDVVDIGSCPTPLQYFSIHHLNLDGGIMITGSHNPPEYNGFKISVGKGTIHGDAIKKLGEIAVKGDWTTASRQGSVAPYDITRAYREYMHKEFSSLTDARYKRLTIVVDAGNGTGGLVAPDVLRDMGCEVVPLYCEPDGRFPNHHPDPTVVEYIQDLIATTKKLDADFGVGYDGDSDRIGVVDRDGTVIWGDQLMIILSRDLLSHTPGAKVIGDVKCSQVLFDDVARHGGTPIMWKTGHSLVKQKMRDEKAPLAGEFSGHIFIGDRYFGFDDALYTTFRLVEIMKKSGKSLKDLLADVPRMHFTPEIRVDCPEDMKKRVVGEVVQRFQGYRNNGGSPHAIKDISTIDGIRVVFDKGWGLVRVSNTQPVIVMRFEAEDKESLDGYRQFFEKEIEVVQKGRGI